MLLVQCVFFLFFVPWISSSSLYSEFINKYQMALLYFHYAISKKLPHFEFSFGLYSVFTCLYMSGLVRVTGYALDFENRDVKITSKTILLTLNN